MVTAQRGGMTAHKKNEPVPISYEDKGGDRHRYDQKSGNNEFVNTTHSRRLACTVDAVSGQRLPGVLVL